MELVNRNHHIPKVGDEEFVTIHDVGYSTGLEPLSVGKCCDEANSPEFHVQDVLDVVMHI